jgi:hypothetical protein
MIVIYFLLNEENLYDYDFQLSFICFFLVFLKSIELTYKKTFVVEGS